MHRPTSFSSRSRPLRVFCVGGGIMGLMAAIELARLARRLRLPLELRLFESGAFGGGRGDRPAAPRCQLWFHRHGTIYAQTQPAVSLALQRSTRRLRQLAPHAFHEPLAVAIDRRDRGLPADACFRVLGVQHTAVPLALLRQWFPQLRLPDDSLAYLVQDGTIDLRLLGHALATHADRWGIPLVRTGVRTLEVQGSHVCQLVLDDGRRVAVAADDVVVLTCGARIRPLLAGVGVAVPGLRLFQSHLIATDAFGIGALLAQLQGGVNAIPHEQADGRLLNLFGNSERIELPPGSDDEPLCADPGALVRLRHEVEAVFGLRIPSHALAWPAVKTEIVTEGIRSQAHHARLVPGLANAWLAIPGKLSQSAACAQDLAIRIIRESLSAAIARPIWEQEPAPAGAPTAPREAA